MGQEAGRTGKKKYQEYRDKKVDMFGETEIMKRESEGRNHNLII